MPEITKDKQAILRDPRYLEVTYSAARAPQGIYPSLLARHLMETVYLRKGTLLDIGCGRGDYLEAFSRLGYDITGIDISPYPAGSEVPCSVHQCNLETEPLPFPENTFDFIFSKSVIEHLHSPYNLVSGALRVLKPGGVAVIMTPSWSHTYWGPFYIDHTHVTPYTLPSLSDLLQITGFQEITTEYFYQLPVTWRFPRIKPFIRLFAALPFPYRPNASAPWPDTFNKWIRFSKEVMILAIGKKTSG